jgi:choline dehydrogenase-like flavoprotein
MEVEDLCNLQDGLELHTELCIVGSGPAGLTIASEFIGTEIQTLVLESGGMATDPVTDRLSEVESVGQPRIMEQHLVRNRVFGGTSHSWTGRCAPLDEIDFAARPWVPFSGWPMTRRDIDPFIDRASGYLGIGPSTYDERLSETEGCPIPPSKIDRSLLRHCFWQFSSDVRRPLDYMRFGPAFLQKTADNVRVLLRATVSQIMTNPNGSQVLGLEVSTPSGKRITIRPRAVVLCAGGIENARILLYSDRVFRPGVGNHHGMVGRFLMDHPRCTLAEFQPNDTSEVRNYYGLFRLGKTGVRNAFVQGITLSPEVQKRDGLLNCAAWLTEDRAPDDPWDAAKRLLSGDRARPGVDVWSIVSQPRVITRGIRDRVVRGRGLPHKLRRLVLDCIVEQRPDPDSRLSLSDRKDGLGLPIARLDWRISDQERQTVATFGNLICGEFQRIGLAKPKLADWAQRWQLEDSRFVDVCHPTGTTRMASDARSGVVDTDCKVHGTDALYVAGSSVFPTTGHANPTLMIVALAIRLADRLKQTLRQ